MQLRDLLTLSVGFIKPDEVLWELQCSTGWLNICEMKFATLTDEVAGQGLLLPATNLRMIDGWIPQFDSQMARMVRPETQTLVIMNCYVRLFVIREMLRVILLDGNIIEDVKLFETSNRFEVEVLGLENNRLTDLSFLTKLSRLNSLDVSGNRLSVLKMDWFSDLPNLQVLELKSNQIKSLETSHMVNLPIERLYLSYNLLTEFNTKNFLAKNLNYINLNQNRLQSINTVKLSRSFPHLTSIDYDDNPWNCGRLESLQFYLDSKRIKNYTQNKVKCTFDNNIHTIALKLPELVDISEEKLDNVRVRVDQLFEIREEAQKITGIDSRFGKTQRTVRQINDGLARLRKKYDLLKGSLDWFDFYDIQIDTLGGLHQTRRGPLGTPVQHGMTHHLRNKDRHAVR